MSLFLHTSSGTPPSASALVLAAALLVPAAAGDAQAAAKIGASQQVAIDTPAAPEQDALKDQYQLPEAIPFPAANPYTPAKAALGKTLYFDPRLSASRSQSCATCHSPGFGWGDGLPTGIGHDMNPLGRRSPTVVNAAWGTVFMWDGRFGTLEEQALGPIESAVEMNLPLPELVRRLNNVDEYRPLFEAAFPGEPISAETVGRAIATYERTLVSVNSPFDDWIAGDEDAITEEAKRGFDLFNGKGACAACHFGWNFTDDSFHDIGLPSTDAGRGQQLPDVIKMQRAFKTPGLRDIDRRGPYMHDGSLPTLQAVIEHYDFGGIARRSRSDLMRPLGLTEQEKADLVAFLLTLTSPLQPTAAPALPR